MNTKDYRTMQAELDELLAWFESSDIDLDSATEKYQEAVKLIKNMEKYLQTAENKIKTVTAKQ